MGAFKTATSTSPRGETVTEAGRRDLGGGREPCSKSRITDNPVGVVKAEQIAAVAAIEPVESRRRPSACRCRRRR